MVSLLDIAPARETVTVGGVGLEVRGISAADIAILMQRFGNIFELLQGGDFVQMAGAFKPAIGAVIAAGVGELGNLAAETHAAAFPIGDQASLLAAIRRLTMPAGIRPFVQDLRSLGLLDSGLDGLDAMASAATSPKPSSNSNGAAMPTQ